MAGRALSSERGARRVYAQASTGPGPDAALPVHPYQRFVPPKVKTFVDFLVKRYGKGYDWARYKGNQG